MIARYYHSIGGPKPYGGELTKVFEDIRRDLRETAIYSDDKQEFVRKFFKSRLKGNSNEAVEIFLATLEERGFLQPEYFFAFGEIKEAILIDPESNKAELDKIAEARRNLERIKPDNLRW